MCSGIRSRLPEHSLINSSGYKHPAPMEPSEFRGFTLLKCGPAHGCFVRSAFHPPKSAATLFLSCQLQCRSNLLTVRGAVSMIRSQLQEFMRRMDQKSVAIIPSAREATRSNDTQYRFRQDSDFYYLTGFE